jgi:DNA-directed RNA polymerase specialized sigma24 family protein
MWTLVIDAAARGDQERAAEAFRQLCTAYRDAIVRFMRARGVPADDVEDAAHDFLQGWLGRENPLAGFERGERRFREFLSVCLRRFLTDWYARRTALRRGGGARHEPLDGQSLPADAEGPEALCDRSVAQTAQELALGRLARQWQGRIPQAGYDRLRAVALAEIENPGYQELAQELGVAIGTVKSWIFRLRREYYEAFREAVRPLAAPDGLDLEVRHLFDLLAREPSPDRKKANDRAQPPSTRSR